MKNRKNVIMIVMLVAIALMSMGYALFATQLNINSIGNITSSWNIYFESISAGTKVGNASNVVIPSVSGTSANMNVNLNLPGDSMTYELVLKNGGTVPAIIEDIKAEATGSSAIVYTMSGLNIGDKLAGGASKTITIKIEYDPNTSSQPSETSKTLTVSIDAVQDIGQTITTQTPSIEGEIGTLARTILNDNQLYNDQNIDFGNPSGYISEYKEVFSTTIENVAVNSAVDFYSSYTFDKASGSMLPSGSSLFDSWSNMGTKYEQYPYFRNGSCNFNCIYKIVGYVNSTTAAVYKYTSEVNKTVDNEKGLYYTSTNTEGNRPTYYFRGRVENNYVSFANKIWRIVRINEDGSIRLITQDVIGNSAFNSTGTDNAYVGYMFGTTGATGSNAYALTHTNTNDSTIKWYLDNWYETNLKTNYSKYIADSGFCNDRSVSSGNGYGTGGYTQYSGTSRIYNLQKPQIVCSQTNDLFTTKTSTKGNKALDYPIGLITADELVFAGFSSADINYSSYSPLFGYLDIGEKFWTMTPSLAVDDMDEFTSVIFTSGDYYSPINQTTSKNTNVGVRPVINLNSNVQITSGNGTKDNPYVVNTN